MPEEQQPFLHEDGSMTPAEGATLEAFLRPSILEALAKSLRVMASGCRRNAVGRLFELLSRQAMGLDAAATILDGLRVPVINATVTALVALPPDIQGIVSSAAAQLLEAGPSRHRLVRELRAVLERKS